MSGPPARIHNLRSNAGERSPRRLLVIDTEASSETAGKRQLQQLRLWGARLLERHPKTGQLVSCQESWGQSREEVAELVDASCRSGKTLWAFTHNLSYDLVTTSLPLLLCRRGFELRQHNFASDAPWGLLRRRTRSVRLADSWSWLPLSVELLGQALGMQKPALPAEDDSELSWRERCRADLEITCAALLGLMAEWDRLKLGWWSLTGPATAWNSMLHMAPRRHLDGPAAGNPEGARQGGRLLVPVPVIDPSPEARAFERQAIFSGRRDLWRVGKLPPGPYHYLDFRSAHLAVCASHQLPDRRGQPFAGLELGDWRLEGRVRSVVAECLLRCAEPRYPLRWRGAVLHPVGTFATVLCGPELKEARDRGELLRVGRGYSYRLGAHMQPWAQWALPLVSDPATACDPMLRVFLKGASRTVPGRWGMLVSRELLSGPSHVDGWELERTGYGPQHRRGFIFHLGGRWTELVRDQEADDAFPAVLAHIQSWVRVYLARALDRLGQGAALQVNTDSLLLPERRLFELAGEREGWLGRDPDTGSVLAAACAELSAACAPLELRVKASAQHVELLSPQHLRLDRQRLYSGVPANAEEVEPGVFEWWTWPKLAGQLERGDPRGYIRELRRVRLPAVPVNRWAFEDGCCEPVEAAWTAAEGTQLLPPAPPRLCRHGKALRALQHPLLRRLL